MYIRYNLSYSVKSNFLLFFYDYQYISVRSGQLIIAVLCGPQSGCTAIFFFFNFIESFLEYAKSSGRHLTLIGD